MKFAKSLQRNEIPEWSQWYIDYKSLKKLVNQTLQEIKQQQEPISDDNITAPFFYAIDRNIETVDSFYNGKFAEYSRRLRHVEQYFTGSSNDDIDKVEVTAMLLELRGYLRNLQCYAEVNKQGFMKILKKFDKKIGTRAKTQYMSSKINILGFSNCQDLHEKIGIVNKLLHVIAPEVKSRAESPMENLPGGAQIDSTDVDANKLTPIDALKLAIDSDSTQKAKDVLLTADIGVKQISTLLVRAVAVHANKTLPLLVSMAPEEAFTLNDAVNRPNILYKIVISEGRKLIGSDKDAHADVQIDAGKRIRTHARVDVTENCPKNHSGVRATERGLVINQHHYDQICTSVNIFMRAVAERSLLGLLANVVDLQLRTPLHYAARYGLADVVQTLLELLGSSDILSMADSDDLMPIDLAVLYGHPRTLNRILSFKPPMRPMLLITAARLDSSEICTELVKNGKYDINYRDASSRGETSLHIAVKHNHISTVKVLVSLGADLEIKESLYGWTPLFLAAVDGLEDVCKVLLEAGARADILDNSGWSPKEHAVLRGHLKFAEILPLPKEASLNNNPEGSAPGLDKRRNNDNDGVLKTFGHKYLEDKDEMLVLVTLGSRDLRMNSVDPVHLDKVPLTEAGNTQLDTALSLIVHASSTTSESHYVDLPVPELGLATEPIPFFTKDLASFNLIFDLVPTYRNRDESIARGVYSLPNLAGKMQDLNLAMQNALIVEANSLRILGKVNFEILIVKPFVHPNNTVNANTTYWRSLITTRVIGHRGLGKNTGSNSSLQLGENTVESFIQAANLGAGYVEFDVQLTKDGIPVIYHDFLVGDSGFDIPMHSMTFDQFMNIHTPASETTDKITRHEKDIMDSTGLDTPVRWNKKYEFTSDVPLPGTAGDYEPSSEIVDEASKNIEDYPEEMSSKLPRILKKRSNSVRQFNSSNELDPDYTEAYRRMRFTRDFKAKGYKGNVRGLHIQSKFATLQELFKSLPSGLGFNIEFKYPMLDEAEAEEMDGNVIEINRFVDTILKVIFDNRKERDIILSSFNPDVCILLSLKQPSIPVLFLTEGGTAPMMDIRASSLQEAIRFSKRFNLLGIVSEALPLIMCPRLVRAVKELGLVCFTYGTENNVPENARIQLDAGVDAVIVDSVLAIRKELTDYKKNDESDEYGKSIETNT